MDPFFRGVCNALLLEAIGLALLWVVILGIFAVIGG